MPSFRSTLIDLEAHTRRRYRYMARAHRGGTCVAGHWCALCASLVEDPAITERDKAVFKGVLAGQDHYSGKPICCLDCREKLIGAVTVCEPDSSGGLAIVDDLYSKIETMDVCIETKSGKKVWSYLIRRIAELARKA